MVEEKDKKKYIRVEDKYTDVKGIDSSVYKMCISLMDLRCFPGMKIGDDRFFKLANTLDYIKNLKG